MDFVDSGDSNLMSLFLGELVESRIPLMQNVNLVGDEQVVDCLEAKRFVQSGQRGKELEVPQAQIVVVDFVDSGDSNMMSLLFQAQIV